MLFRQNVLQGITEGRVTLALRRWRRSPPAAGSTLRSPVGVLVLERVTVIEEGDITQDDVQRTGMSLRELQRSISGDGTLLRIELRLAGEDPRIALRGRRPNHEHAEIAAGLDRLDRAASSPWTGRYLQLIATHPGTGARTLAADADTDLPRFKRRVRQLKEFGLTESLETGYQLSPRGHAVLARL
jgi:hypothetical protein